MQQTMNPCLRPAAAVIFLLCFIACRQKKKDKQEEFFPVISYIQSQVAHVDTSLYPIRKIVSVDSLRNDTIYMRREAFREAARDFLSLPDLSASKYADRYTEDKQFDETMNRVLIVYTPVKPEKEEIQRQEILIEPDPGGDKVTNIIIHSIIHTRDSLVEKRLLWTVDKSFQVISTRQLPGQAETTSTFRVIWNEDDNE
jgi:hypothetical protein